MTTIAIPRKSIETHYQTVVRRVSPYSFHALLSIFCIIIFASFLMMYQMAAFDALSSTSRAMLTMLSVVVAPALGLYFSVISLRRYVKQHHEVRGMFLAYISFFVSSLYFVTALAMPLVLLGMYVIYVYIW
jgi:hypothetical protein